MPKDLLLYGHIYEGMAARFFESIDKAIEAAGEGEVEFKLRINTDGGEPHYMLGMLNKIQELKISEGLVDGMAMSAGAFACCLLNKVVAVDGSQFLIHRAAMWTEAYPEMMSTGDTKRIQDTNKYFKKILKAKVDVAKFEKIAKHTIDEIFSMEDRIDVVLTSAEALSCGLIDEVIKLTPSRKKKIEAYVDQQDQTKFKLAARKILKAADPDDEEEEEEQDEETPAAKPIKSKTEKPVNMTIEKIKAEFPAVYASIKKEGVEEERDRAGAWLAMHELDPKRAIEGALADKPMGAKATAEFTNAALSSDRLSKLKADSKTTPETEEAVIVPAAVTAHAKELEDAQARIDKSLGRKPKTVVA